MNHKVKAGAGWQESARSNMPNAFAWPQKPVYNPGQNWRIRACSAIKSPVIPNRDRDLI
jgi:cytochrome c peroxidase